MRYGENILKLLLGIAGAALLAAMFARCGPWQMCAFMLHTGSQSFVALQLPLLGSIPIAYEHVVWFCAALLPATVFFFSTVRHSASHMFRSRPACILFPAALAVFILTFFSGFFLEEKIAAPQMLVRSVALYLTLGLSAVIFFFTGIGAAIADQRIWQRLSSFLFTVKLPWLLSSLFIGEFLFANLISYYVFEHIPHIQDSFAQLFQANIFATGHLTAPSPPVKEVFYYQHIIDNGRWYSQYPPGHAFLLMLGVFAKAPWIVNPLVGSITIVLFYFLGRELYSDRVGRLASLLGFFSPFLLFMSSEFMNHVTGLFLFTAFMLLYARAVRLKALVPALIAGAALGWIITIRPLSAVTLALPFITHAATLLATRFRQYRLVFFVMAVPALAGIAILLCYNYLTNGDPLLFGYQVLHGNEHLPGLGRAAWGETLTLGLGIRHTLHNFVGLNKYLFEWPVPSLVFACLLFASGRANKWDVMLLGSFFFLAFGYLFYWYQDWCFGPRFLYEAAGCAILLTARGICCTPYLVRRVLGRPVPVRRIHTITAAIIFFCMAYGLATNVPALYKHYRNSYWFVDAKLPKAVEGLGLQKAVIFVRHAFALPANAPFLDNGIIYVWDSEKLRRQVMARYPGYKYFLSDKDHLTEISP